MPVPPTPTSTAFPSLTGSQLLDMVDDKLAGKRNAYTQRQKLTFLNEGKDEIWKAIRQLKDRYFVINSQATDNTKTNYFPALTTTSREYTLPVDCRDVIFIEVTAPTGFEYIRFVKKSITSPEFREERRTALANFNNSVSTVATDTFYYDIVGKLTFELAQFPDQPYTLTVWYERALADIQTNVTFDEILFPWTKELADYAAMSLALIGEPEKFSAWATKWRNDIVTTMQTADRDSADIVTVSDYFGE